MQEAFIKVNDEGYEIDVVLFATKDDEGNEVEIPRDLVPPNTEKRLFTPRWDFELGEWVEAETPEEVARREAEIEEQYKQPTETERLREENELLKYRLDSTESAVLALMDLSLMSKLQGGD